MNTPGQTGGNARQTHDPDRAFLVSLCEHFGGECVVIGGWAVHARGGRGDPPPDGDLVVSAEAWAVLRDSFGGHAIPLARKESLRSPADGDVDLYVEGRHRLALPLAVLRESSTVSDGLRVAAPEHLVVLKRQALAGRGQTPRGAVDRSDLRFLRSRWPAAAARERPTPVAAALPPMAYHLVVNRRHTPIPSKLVTLDDLCREAGWDFPVQTDRPVRVERLSAPEPAPLDLAVPGENAQVHWRNHPDGSYSTALGDAADIIGMLAYEAREWQAWETVRRRNVRRGAHRFALLT